MMMYYSIVRDVDVEGLERIREEREARERGELGYAIEDEVRPS